MFIILTSENNVADILWCYISELKHVYVNCFDRTEISLEKCFQLAEKECILHVMEQIAIVK